jgi:hypothetical protein
LTVAAKDPIRCRVKPGRAASLRPIDPASRPFALSCHSPITPRSWACSSVKT